jgi:hypothetical protein
MRAGKRPFFAASKRVAFLPNRSFIPFGSPSRKRNSPLSSELVVSTPSETRASSTAAPAESTTRPRSTRSLAPGFVNVIT